jgi:integrase
MLGAVAQRSAGFFADFFSQPATVDVLADVFGDIAGRRALLALVVKICLSTGARWREAVNLTRSQVTKYRITFVRTKGKKNRSIPISKELYEEIIALDGFRFFTDCYFQFLSVMDKTSIALPRGQLTHVLRHTFAAHFMMSGGNILALQKILGHHDIKRPCAMLTWLLITLKQPYASTR